MGESPIGGTNIRMSAQTQGLGPLFRIDVEIQNTGTKPLFNVGLSVTFNHDVYHMQEPHTTVPVLLPNVVRHVMLDIMCVDPIAAASESVRVFLLNQDSTVPYVTATITMPQSELDE